MFVRKYITVDRLSETLGVSPGYIRYLARNNQLPAAKIGRRWLIAVEDAEIMIEEAYEKQRNTGGQKKNGTI